MTDRDFVAFLQWCLPRLGLRWEGFRKVRGTVRKRVARRLRELRLADLEEYRALLERDPSEWAMLESFCRIPISRFYRDRAVYAALERMVLPDCIDRARQDGRAAIHVLSAGCASGEEPYTVALIWHVRMAARAPGMALDVLALDVDETMLARARTGIYAAGSLKDLPRDVREAGFSKAADGFLLKDACRAGVTFEQRDMREALPEGPFDIVLCRNCAFTYFDGETQRRVFADLDARLRPGGYLVIGNHENLPEGGDRYEPLAPGLPVLRKP